MPAYNEAEGITESVARFRALPEVDEVIVVDNNSRDATAELAQRAGATVVKETRQGYGFASQRALESASDDYVIIVESDGTFRPNDLYKFLAYAAEFDVVFGTRTSKTCIWAGSNMGLFLRYGNWAVAKLLEYMHNGPCLTDVGCTYKLLNRRALEHLLPLLTVGHSHFSPELMILAIRSKLDCVEIPVHYQARKGTSKITGSFWKAFKLGIRMIVLVFQYRFRHIPPVPAVVDDPESRQASQISNGRGGK
jgi:glycosyltransferase involved in cell wall biosynthesis